VIQHFRWRTVCACACFVLCAVARAQDCNTNGQSDATDITSGVSLDINTNSVPDECEPYINVWYGQTQHFGTMGRPQIWVNLLGNVSDPDGISDLSYTLNGGVPHELGVGADSRRLYRDGDFNIEIGFAELNAGANPVVITAVDFVGNMRQRTVTIDYPGVSVWPATYGVDFASVAALANGAPDLNGVAQVVDGLWAKDTDGVHPAIAGYNRVIAIGDETWTDYEVTVSLRVNAVDPSGFNPVSTAPGFGMQFRWRGNTSEPPLCVQPRCGWLPSGAGLWYDYSLERLSLGGALGDSDFFAGDPQERSIDLGQNYFFKARVETVATGTFYGAKIWREGAAQPADWEFSGISDDNDPPSGSFYLIAHHTDVTFRTVNVAPLSTSGGDGGGGGGGGGGGAPGGDFCFFYDDDFDGVNNCDDACPVHADKFEPGVCGCDAPDVDTDDDGVLDCNDGCPEDSAKTSPDHCGCGQAESDRDGDGLADCADGCPDDVAKTAPGACGCGLVDADTNGDGVTDCIPPCEGTADSDGDGTIDCLDGCPNNTAKAVTGLCGCDGDETDSDGDGTPDCVDRCPDNPAKTTLGACGCHIAETDGDGDGTPDCADQCPDDPRKKAPGGCGCGVRDWDVNSNGQPDCLEASTGGNDNNGGENPPPAQSCGGGACGAAGIPEMALLMAGFAQLRSRRHGPTRPA
jgi:hypothetical protein